MDALDELESVLGPDRLTREPEILEEYASDLSLSPRRVPEGVVFPRSCAEVQSTVQWANKTGLSLIPVSSGPPRARGDTVPWLGGVILDLKEMKRIIRVDRRNRVTLIEPGVTFAQLVPELAAAGVRLNLPLLPRGTKSVVTSALEREPPMSPRYQWDASDPLCCVEAVFGTGDVLWTGEAAGPGSLEKQWEYGGAQKFPLGPHQVDYHRILQGAQGTIGVVTWASIKCEQIPAKGELVLIPSKKLDDLVHFAYTLIRYEIGDELFLVNALNLACMVCDDPAEIPAVSKSLPPWILVVCLSGYSYFPEERIMYLRKDMLELAQQDRLEPKDGVAGIKGEDLHSILQKPSDEPYWKARLKGGYQDIFFLSRLEEIPRYVQIAEEVLGEGHFPVHDVGMYFQPMVQGTSCHLEFRLNYNPDDQTQVGKLPAILAHTTRALLRAGAFFSRPYPAWAAQVFEHQATYRDTLRKLKSVFDPNNVLNPGKLCF